VLSGVSRVAVLEVVRANGPLDVQAITAQVGLHPNTVRSHLDQLVEAGLVESTVQPRSTPGRPRLLFRAAAHSSEGPEDSYKVLAGILAASIDGLAPVPGAAAAEAGRRWGQSVVPSEPAPVDGKVAVDRIVALLDDVGFAPRLRAQDDATVDTPVAAEPVRPPDAGPTVIELHRCPFYDVARDHGEVVCAVHLGLVQGALEQMQAPTAAVRIEPFVGPHLCLVHLQPTDADHGRPGTHGGAA
jgi:predicted ArsR family transcriptional regulator